MITPEEAIRPLKELSARKKMADQCDQASASDIRLYHALDTAIEALEKQIPKKPVIVTIRNVDYPKCPVCGRVLWGKEYYCANCGQAVERESKSMKKSCNNCKYDSNDFHHICCDCVSGGDETPSAWEPKESEETNMELKDNVEMAPEYAYKERLKEEYHQTKQRYEKLKAYNTKIEAAGYTSEIEMPPHKSPADILHRQQRVMGEYLHLLELRAVFENIEL